MICQSTNATTLPCKSFVPDSLKGWWEGLVESLGLPTLGEKAPNIEGWSTTNENLAPKGNKTSKEDTPRRVLVSLS